MFTLKSSLYLYYVVKGQRFRLTQLSMIGLHGMRVHYQRLTEGSRSQLFLRKPGFLQCETKSVAVLYGEKYYIYFAYV